MKEIDDRLDVDCLYGLKVSRVKLAKGCDNSEYPRGRDKNVKAPKSFNDLVKGSCLSEGIGHVDGESDPSGVIEGSFH